MTKDARETATQHLARCAHVAMTFGGIMPSELWWLPTCAHLARNLKAAAETGDELPEETLKTARDFLGVLVGR